MQENASFQDTPSPAGIDIGSTTAKVVVLGDDRRPVFTAYRRHNADVAGTLATLLGELREQCGNLTLKLSLTGSAGLGLAEQATIPFVQEVIAAAEAVDRRYPATRTLIDVGGEDTKMILFNEHMRPDIRMNGNCAGGTGAFIDQMASLLDVTPAQLDELAAGHETIHTIASRCGVFAKTDVQNLLSRDVSRADIAASIYHAVALQTVNTLSRGHIIEPGVLFCGGPLTFSASLRQAFMRVLDLTADQVILPEHPELFPALGAALSDVDAPLILPLDQLIERMEQTRHTMPPATSLPPLFTDEQDHDSWRQRKTTHRTPRVPLKDLHDAPVFLGIDAGSTTTKIVLVDDEGRIAFTHYAPNHGDHLGSVRNGLTTLGEQLDAADVRPRITRTAVTGYGEDLIRTAFGMDEGLVETLAHQCAARAFDPEVSFILDIGGQDMKAIFLEDGIIDNIEINEACSSGCGSFLETFAGSLGYDAPTFARLGCEASAPRDLGSRCTVFMNSKVKQCLREGSSVGDIAAGLAYSVIKNCLHKVLKLHDTAVLGEHIVVQGGTFRNEAVLRALELLLEHEVTRPDICELMGAYGAALTARDRADGSASTFVGLDHLEDTTVTARRTLTCKGCENHCHISRLTFSTGRTFHQGNRCENIFSNDGDDKTCGDNLWNVKHDLLFERPCQPAGPSRGTIGIPRVLNIFENYPFWCTLLTEAGFTVELSAPSTDAINEKGAGSVMSENICFPAKLAHGHIRELMERGVDRIFYPMVNYEAPKFAAAINTYTCPVVAGYPDVIRSAIDPDAAGIPLDTPHMVFNDEGLLQKACTAYLTGLGVDERTAREAWASAREALEDYNRTVEQLGREMLARARETDTPVILLVGRPYHLDPLVNHKIPEIIARFGMTVITEDAIPPAEQEGLGNVAVLSQWEYPNRLYRAAHWAGSHNIHLIQLNSFGCGPDALTVDEVRDIVRSYGGHSTFLRIDEITSTGSVRLRLRSLFESMTTAPGSRPAVERPHTPLFTAADRDKTIIAPVFSPYYSRFLEAAFRGMGHHLEILPPPDRESVELGLKYANNDICYPAIICIGDIIKALQSGRYDPQQTVAGLTETGGPCRASNYACLLKKALMAAGFDSVPVVTLTTGKHPLNEQPGFQVKSARFTMDGFATILFNDVLTRMHYATAVRELHRGDTQCITDRYLTLQSRTLGRHALEHAFELLEQARNAYNYIPTRERLYPKVGIVGEIYAKYNPFANNNLDTWLMDQGIEVIVPPLLNFFTQRLVDVDTNKENHITDPSWLTLAGHHVAEHYVDRQIARANELLAGLHYPVTPLATIRELAGGAREILSLGHQYGEGWMIAAEVAALAQEGTANIVCVQPFGCIANHVIAKGAGRRMQELYPQLSILFLDVDPGNSEANMHNRLQFIVKNAQRDAEATARHAATA